MRYKNGWTSRMKGRKWRGGVGRCKELAMEMGGRCRKEEMEKGMMIACAAWNGRNKKIMEGKDECPRRMVDGALNFLKEFQEATKRTTPVTREQVPKWKPPNGDVVKVNFDGGFNKEDRKGSEGVIVRDETGFVMVACCWTFDFVPSPEVVEAKVAIGALIFARELGFQQIILEGDAKRIVERMKDCSLDFSVVVNLIEVARVISKGFRACHFAHVIIQVNMAVHMLAKQAFLFSISLFG